MDASGVTIQFISHCASFSGKRDCIVINNDIAAAVKAHPNRFAGLASLSMGEPVAAAEELRRCIRDLGISGAMIDNHVNGKYYEAYEYDVFWSTAQELDSPIYLHPTLATNNMKEWYEGSYSPAAAASMSMDAFGWHYDTATHITRIYAAGVFDRFPKLKIVLGHFGESLPFWKQRIATSKGLGALARSFNEVYDENLWFTTSGVFGIAPLACMLQNTAPERIMFSIDYPFTPMAEGIIWLEELRNSGLVSQEQLEMICHGNAEKLFGLPSTPSKLGLIV
uniref:Amidohydrolase-related domain-containing protein n=1 Tax=Bionectria ochroleuca TaxID=29856 RepID=A0A8H7NPW0_BIOOC